MSEIRNTSKRALFVCYGGGHISTCLPVASELKERGWEIYIIALTTAFKYAQDHGWSPLGFKDFIEDSDWAQINEIGVDFEKDISPLISLEESKAYLGLSYLDLMEEYGEYKAKELYGKGGRLSFLPLGTMRKALGKIKPDVLITTASPRAEHAAQIVASEYGIKRVCFLPLPDEHSLQRVVSNPAGGHICVVDLHAKNRLLELGMPAYYLHVTGNPSYDSLRTVKDFEIQAMKSRLNIEEGKISILWASQIEPEMEPITGEKGDPELPRKIEAVLRRMVLDRDDIRLIVRYHPNEICDFLNGKNVSFSPREDDVNVLLNVCDIVVTMTSTVAFQAAHLGKPVISVDLSVFSKTLGLSELGVSRGIRDISEIPAVIDDVLLKRSASDDEDQGEIKLSSVAFANVVEKIFEY